MNIALAAVIFFRVPQTERRNTSASLAPVAPDIHESPRCIDSDPAKKSSSGAAAWGAPPCSGLHKAANSASRSAAALTAARIFGWIARRRVKAPATTSGASVKRA
jgi:hypothetical protein